MTVKDDLSDAEKIETLLEAYRLAVRAAQRAETDAGACRTRRDYDVMHDLEHAEEAVRSQVLQALQELQAKATKAPLPKAAKTRKAKITYTTEDGDVINNEDDIAGEIDDDLQSSGRMFLHGSDGHRYLASVAVTFVRSDED